MADDFEDIKFLKKRERTDMIHYICGYAKNHEKNKRKFSPAGVAKMEYMMLCMKELHANYCVYSTCQTSEPKCCKKQVAERITYRASLATNNKYTFYIDRFFAILQLILYLIKIPSRDTVLVYHERFYTRWVNFIHKIKKWNLIYEIEEIYTMVQGDGKKDTDKEITGLQKACCGYILATDLLKNYFTGEAIVCNGVYHPVHFDSNQKARRNTTHVVYGGTLDKTKGGAAATAMAAAFLPCNYHVHILGFGDGNQISSVKELVNQINSTSAATVTYDGMLQGDEYRKFLNKCDIGLSAQNPGLIYNDTSFPSKILEYLRNGVNVVSINIPVVKRSAVSSLVTFYENQTPSELSKAIQSAKIYPAERIIKTLNELHREFKKDFAYLLRIKITEYDDEEVNRS